MPPSAEEKLTCSTCPLGAGRCLEPGELEALTGQVQRERMPEFKFATEGSRAPEALLRCAGFIVLGRCNRLTPDERPMGKVKRIPAAEVGEYL